MKPLPLLLATALAVAAVTARAEPEQLIGGNVEALLEFARDRHPEFAAMRLEAEAAAARVAPAGALPEPMFRAELRDISNENNPVASPNLLPALVGNTRYTVSQALPWYGKRELRQEVAAAAADDARGRERATWADLARQIKLTYALHHVHLASLRLRRENLDLLTQIEQIAQARYANGLVPQQDVIRAQTERTALRSELAMLEGESEQASARIRALLGRPANVRIRPPEQLRPLPPAARIEFAALETRLRANNPKLASDDARILGSEKSRELAYKNRYPDFSVGLSPIQTRERITGWDLMVEVNIPLQQSRRRDEERAAERALDAARSRKEATLNQALAELSESLAGMKSARRVEELVASSLLPQAELTLQAALAGYETGRVDFAAVLDAQRQIRKAREDLVRARADQQVRMAEIERLIGEDI